MKKEKRVNENKLKTNLKYIENKQINTKAF